MNTAKHPRKELYDVIVCGGGLAGQTLARQLKLNMPELSVMLIDKFERPLPIAAFKVGESSVEFGASYLTDSLHLRDYFERTHLHKLGLRYFIGSPELPFEQRPEFGLSKFAPVYSYQIDRGVLENDLRGFNVEAGVELVEGVTVKDIELGPGDEPHTVIYEDRETGEVHKARCTWVVDAMSRRRMLQRKLDLAKPNIPTCSAVWWRVKFRADLCDFVPQENKAWHDRVPMGMRYYSTNHLQNDGYWVWLIALCSGSTSIGIVTDENIHPFDTYHTHELAMEWLKKNEPEVFKLCDGVEFQDFIRLRHYAFSSKQVFSTDRWCCVGEAGVFADPFFSPGNDMIGLANTITTHLVKNHRAGTLTQSMVDELNQFLLAYNDGVTWNIHSGYPNYGKPVICATKLMWDVTAGWATAAPLMFNTIFLKPVWKKIRLVTSRFPELSHRVQMLFKEWGKKTPNTTTFDFLDYLSVPFIRDLRLRNLQLHKSDAELLQDHAQSMQTLEEFAQVVFLLAVRDTMPEQLERFGDKPWLNAWAVGLDPEKWEADGLFQPTSAPRDLTPIREQIESLFRFAGSPAPAMNGNGNGNGAHADSTTAAMSM